MYTMTNRIQKYQVNRLVFVAGHLADSLYRFVEELPENAREIRGVISTLFEIKTLLNEFDGQSMDPKFGRLDKELLDDTILGIEGCASTLTQLDGIVLRCNSSRRSSSPRSARKCWQEILSVFKNIESSPIQYRLDSHKTFLFHLVHFLRTSLVSSRSIKRIEQKGASSRDTREEQREQREQIHIIASQQKKAVSKMREIEEAHRREIERRELERREMERREMEKQHHAQQYSPQQYSPQQYSPHYSPQMASFVPTALPTPPLSYDSPPQRPYSTPLPQGPYQAPPGQHSPYGHAGHRFMPNIMTHDQRPMTPISPISPISPLNGTPPMISRRYSNTPGPYMQNTAPYAQNPAPYAQNPVHYSQAPAPQASRTATPPTPPLRPKTRQSSRQQASKQQKGQWWTDVLSSAMSRESSAMLPQQSDMSSECFGMEMETLNMAPEDHEIFRVEFDNDLMLRMFRNEKTEAAKVVCTKGGGHGSWNSGRRNGYRFQTFIDASYLTIERVGSALHLNRRGILWALLCFADYEQLTLVYHTFLALRHQGPNAPPTKKEERWPKNEELVFCGKIDDEGHLYKLRLLKDHDSGSLRLASVKGDGEFEVTVWTAFVGDLVCTNDWIYFSRPDSSAVIVKNIRQFSFSSYFETNLWKDFELKFCIREDAKNFACWINHERRLRLSAERKNDYRRSPRTPVNIDRNGYF